MMNLELDEQSLFFRVTRNAADFSKVEKKVEVKKEEGQKKVEAVPAENEIQDTPPEGLSKKQLKKWKKKQESLIKKAAKAATAVRMAVCV